MIHKTEFAWKGAASREAQGSNTFEAGIYCSIMSPSGEPHCSPFIAINRRRIVLGSDPSNNPSLRHFFLLRCWCPHITCSFASSVAAESPVLLKTKTWLWKEIISSATQCHSMRFVWHVLFSSLTGFICLKVRKGHFYSLYGLYKTSCCLPVQQHHQSTTTWLIHSRYIQLLCMIFENAVLHVNVCHLILFVLLKTQIDFTVSVCFLLLNSALNIFIILQTIDWMLINKHACSRCWRHVAPSTI